MNNWKVTLGLWIAAALVFVPALLVLRLLLGILSGYLNFNSNRARMSTVVIPGLGKFESTDGRLWQGAASGIEIAIEVSDESEFERLCVAAQVLLQKLPVLGATAVHFLHASEDEIFNGMAWDRFDVFGMEVDGESSFTMLLTHNSDDDGIYRVLFVNDQPHSWSRDD